MKPIPGAPPSSIRQLPRVQDRLSFLYLERCIIERDSNAITARDENGTVYIPSATIGVLMLGPGCNLTHQAMVLLADSASTVVWVGERGVRCYASGRSLAQSSRMVDAQARLVSNRNTRLEVARQMYAMRFENEDVSKLTMQQLRGREGARIRAVYQDSSREYGVDWSRREYNSDDFADSNAINQALSAAHSCLYGVVHTVVVGLGCSPALGFIHNGHELSFVYDIADLYKAEVSIPIAFQVVGELQGTWSSSGAEAPDMEADWDDLSGIVRRRVRDAMKDGKILVRCTHDIKKLLVPELAKETADEDAVVLSLWDEHIGQVAARSSYGFSDSPRGIDDL